MFLLPLFFSLLNAWLSTSAATWTGDAATTGLVSVTREYLHQPSHGSSPAWPSSTPGCSGLSWPTLVGRCSHSMGSGTLERPLLHRWIPVFTLQGGCMEGTCMEWTNIPWEANGSHTRSGLVFWGLEITCQLVCKKKKMKNYHVLLVPVGAIATWYQKVVTGLKDLKRLLHWALVKDLWLAPLQIDMFTAAIAVWIPVCFTTSLTVSIFLI